MVKKLLISKGLKANKEVNSADLIGRKIIYTGPRVFEGEIIGISSNSIKDLILECRFPSDAPRFMEAIRYSLTEIAGSNFKIL